ncbi:hypothetical protein [Sphingobium agri]|uniref:Transcriptional regulator n=1 Tax=Sphingobium agri TaxID=2933566 RepID=A0ABT0DWH9_9SPHN|nr:hypothetical protein [Sphingobium agri]MCK0531473.1 hypothetical protein [Sphingobium agri]
MSAESRLARDVEERQITMFASFVGPALHITRAALAVASKVPESTLKSYANGAAMPLHAVLAIRPFLPAAAINMLTEPGGVRFATTDAQEANWDAIAASAAGLVAEVCEARKDGQIDHVEKARLRARTRNLIAEAVSAVEEG